jgi:hypothetical protein
MTTSLRYSLFDVTYPDSDGLPMAESDAARDYLIYSIEALDSYCQENINVYVSGNLFIYYEQGNPKAVVAPDVFVVFDVEKKKRLSYKTWEEEGKVSDFILEITSKSTASEDCGTKRVLYAYLGVKEYFQYDPTADYLKPSLQGFRLIEGNYLPIPEQLNGDREAALRDRLSVYSETLGLELWLEANGEMRFYDSKTGTKLLSPGKMEQAKHQAEQRAVKLATKLRELGIDPDSI